MKYLLYSVAAIVLVVVIGLIAVVVLVDPNQFRDQIATKVEQQTGRTMEIEGDIELSVFPWIGLELGRVVLGNAPGFGPTPFAEIEGAEIRVKLIPLLSKQLEVKQVVLDGLRLDLAKDASGRTNWEDLAGGQKKTKVEQKKTQQKPKLAKLMIGAVTLKDGAIRWEDRQAGKTVRIEHLNVNLDQLRFGEPAALDLGFVLHLDDPALKETISLNTDLVIDQDLQHFEFRQIRLQSHTEGQVVPSGRLEANLGTSIVLDLAAQSLSVKDLQLQAAKASVSGSLSGTSILEQPRFSGHFKLKLNPKETLAGLDIQPPRTADSGVLDVAELAFLLNAGTDDLALNDIKGVFDDTHLTGQLAVSSFAKPKIRFQLALDALDVDRYLPEPVATSKQASTTSAPASSTEEPLPLAKLAALDMNGTFQIGKLKVKNVKLEGLKMSAVGIRQVLTLKPEIAHFYQGDYRGTIRIDARERQPSVGLESHIQKVAIGPLLQDYLKKEPPLMGTAFMDMKLGGHGATLTSIKQTLGGNLTLQVKDGSLANVELLSLVKQGEAWWKGEPTPPSSGQIDKLKFVGLDFLATVRNGIVHTDRFLVDSRKLRIEGMGDIDLVHEQLDYSIKAVRLRHQADESGQEVAVAKKWPIIIDVSGPLSKPHYILNVAAMAKARFQKQIDKKKAKIEQKITNTLEKKLGTGAGGLLKGLLSR